MFRFTYFTTSLRKREASFYNQRIKEIELIMDGRDGVQNFFYVVWLL